MGVFDRDEEEKKQMENARREFVVTVLEDYGSDIDARSFDTFAEASNFAQSTPKAMAIYKRTHITVNEVKEAK